MMRPRITDIKVFKILRLAAFFICDISVPDAWSSTICGQKLKYTPSKIPLDSMLIKVKINDHRINTRGLISNIFTCSDNFAIS